MIATRIKFLVERLVAQEQSPHKLALTCAIGAFIGISPFVGFHTVMTFVIAWMFSLNIGILFAVSMSIHNPWTMMPVYALDHVFGQWLLNFCGIDYMLWEPAWVESCNLFLKTHTGISGLSFTAFFIGGNVLALGASFLVYPVARRIFKYYSLPHDSDSAFVTVDPGHSLKEAQRVLKSIPLKSSIIGK